MSPIRLFRCNRRTCRNLTELYPLGALLRSHLPQVSYYVPLSWRGLCYKCFCHLRILLTGIILCTVLKCVLSSSLRLHYIAMCFCYVIYQIIIWIAESQPSQLLKKQEIGKTTSPRAAHPPEGFCFAGRTFTRQCDKVFPVKIRVSKGRLQVNCVNCLASAGVLVALRTAKTVL